MAENRHQTIFGNENRFCMKQVGRHKKPPFCSVFSECSDVPFRLVIYVYPESSTAPTSGGRKRCVLVFTQEHINTIFFGTYLQLFQLCTI